jgi:hypothetical protein
VREISDGEISAKRIERLELISRNMAEKEATDKRLDRIETKIDKVAEAIVTVARQEERLVAMTADAAALAMKVLKIDDRIVHMETKRLPAVELKTHDNSEKLSIISRVVWICVGAIITTIVGVIIVERYDKGHEQEILSPIPVLSASAVPGTAVNQNALNENEQKILRAVDDLSRKISTPTPTPQPTPIP